MHYGRAPFQLILEAVEFARNVDHHHDHDDLCGRSGSSSTAFDEVPQQRAENENIHIKNEGQDALGEVITITQ